MSHPISKNHILITVIACLAVGGASFYGGMLYGNASTNAQRAAARGQFAGQFPGGASGTRGMRGSGGPNGGFVNGSVISKDSTGITVKIGSGGSKIIFVTDKTQTMKSVSGSLDDVTVGSNVMVAGATNADGSVTAESIQIRPSMPPGQDQDQPPQSATTTK